MTKQEYKDMALELKKMEEFLVECDDGLADEVSAQNKICGRIYKAAQDLPRLRRMAEEKARD